MATYTADQLRQALHVLYHNDGGDPVLRKSADEYLQKYLYSTECWQLSLELIQLPGASAYEQLFCARALHVRLRCSVSKPEKKQASHEVMTAAEWEATKTVLVSLAQHWAHAPEGRPVLTQICSAIAALAAKMEVWPTTDVVQDLANAFSFAGASAAMVETLCALPEEIASRHLKIHPQRREHVKLGLTASANVALHVLDLMWEGAAAHHDSRVQVRVLMALAAWIDGGHVNVELVPSSRVLAHAFALLGGELTASHPLLQHPDTLPSLLEVTSAASSVLSAGQEQHVALLHQLLQAIPCSGGAAGAGCCGAGLALLSRAASELLPRLACAPLMAKLLAAMDGGLPGSLRAPVPALQPWTAGREAWEGGAAEWRERARVELREVGLQLVVVGVGRMRAGRGWEEGGGEEDDEEEGEWRGEGGRERRLRDEIQEALRDAAVLVGEEAMVEAVLGELARVQPQAGGGGEAVEALLAGLYAIARLLAPSSPLLPPLFAMAARCTERSSSGEPAPPAVVETAAWVVSGSCKSLRALPEESLDAAVQVVQAALDSQAEATVRAGAVAAMKVCEQAGPAMAQPHRSAPALAHFAAGGPRAPPSSALREGQEPVNLILLRGLLAVAASLPPSLHPAAALQQLLSHALGFLSARMARISGGGEEEEEDMCEAVWEVRKAALVVAGARRALGRSEALKGMVRSCLAPLAALCERPPCMRREALAEAAAELAWAMLQCTAPAEEEAEEEEVVLQLHALALTGVRHGGLSGGSPWLSMLRKSVKREGEEGGLRHGGEAMEAVRESVGAAEAAGQALAGCAVAEALARLLKEAICFRAAPLASPPALAAAVTTCLQMLNGSRGPACLAALDLAAELLLSPFGLRGGDAWDAAVTAVMVDGNGGPALVQGMLEGAGGALPACHVTDVASSLHRFWVHADRGREVQGWLAEGVRRYSAGGRRASDKTQLAFVTEVTSEACCNDVRKLKRCLKAFCGGKKKGAADPGLAPIQLSTPKSVDPPPTPNPSPLSPVPYFASPSM